MKKIFEAEVDFDLSVTGGGQPFTGISTGFTSFIQRAEFFKDLKFKYEETGDGIRIEYEAGIPKKPISFLGLIVDLEDGMCYFTHFPNTEALVLGHVKGILSEVTGLSVGRDEALSFVEKFKLTGDPMKAYELLDRDVFEGSLISFAMRKSGVVKDSAIDGLDGDSILSRLSYCYHDIAIGAKNLAKGFSLLVGYFMETGRDELISEICGITSGFGLDREVFALYKYIIDEYEGIKDYHAFQSVIEGSVVKRIWDTTNYNDDNKAVLVLKLSTMSYWTEGYLYNEPTIYSQEKRKVPLLASNALEMCEAMDAGEVVYSSDYKKKLKELGFGDLLSGREMGYITKQAFVDRAKMKMNNSPDVSNIEEWNARTRGLSTDRKRFSRFDYKNIVIRTKDVTGVRARTSIVELSKYVGRVLAVMK